VLAREQHLHALDGLAAAAAHELGTPLATIVLVARELEKESAPDAPIRPDLQLLAAQAQRCREILGKLTRQPSEADPLHATLSLGQLVDEAATPYRASRATLQIVIRPMPEAIDTAGVEPIGARRPGVVYGLGNIVENAIDFAREQVMVAAEWSAEEVRVTVADDGPGFPPDLIETIGDPYVTSRPPGALAQGTGSHKTSGLGLGFFIAKTLLERSGATLELANQAAPSRGALVTVRWPRAAFEEVPDAVAQWRGATGPALHLHAASGDSASQAT
jgi:two-component system sensor histidine kinase RegB